MTEKFRSRQGKLCCNIKNVLSLLYLGCDLNFIILTFFSTFYSSHPALLVATFELMLRPKTKTLKFTAIAIYSIPIKTTTTQFIFIMQKFKNFHYASHSTIKHQNKIKIPPNFQSCYIKKQFKQNFKSRRSREITPFWSLMLIEV